MTPVLAQRALLALTPTLIVSGDDDRIVTQTHRNDPRFANASVQHVWIENGAHYPWFESPDAVKESFENYAGSLFLAVREYWE